MYTPYFYDPFDLSTPLMQDPHKEVDEQEKESRAGCISSVIGMLIVLAVVIAIILMTSCGTTKDTTLIEQHRIETMMNRMDSVINTRHAVQQDSAWHETILKQFQSIREHSDTSHTFVVDTAGRVIKETLIINNVRETTSETERQEHEMLIHRLDIQDSTMRVMQQHIQHSDSLLQQKQTVVEKEVEKQLNWFQQMQLWMGRLVLVALAVIAVVWVVKKRTWWLALLRKIL